MERNDKIFLAGHNGLVGSAIFRKLQEKSYTNIITRKSSELDLRNQAHVLFFFEKEKPKYVILAAAKVGGIWANNTYRADFIADNLMIQNNVIWAAHKFGVKKLLFLGSSCIYPKHATQPMSEQQLLTGTLEYTNEPYAIAKIAGIKLCESYSLQYKRNFISLMPTNLYGPNDNYDLENSHVLPAIIRKLHLGKLLQENNIEAIRNDLNKRPIKKINGKTHWTKIQKTLKRLGIEQTHNHVTVELWGTGKPMREFLHVDDMADATVFVFENINFTDLYQKTDTEIRNTHLNIGTGKDITIAELANLIKSVVGFNGEIIWNTSKPDGTPRKLLDVSKLQNIGWKASIELPDGIKSNYNWYLQE